MVDNMEEKVDHNLKVWRDKDAQFVKVMSLMRVNDTISLILEGKTRQEIVDYLINKYGISHNTVNVYIAKANNQIKARKQWELDSMIDVHVARYEHLWSLSKTRCKWSSCSGVKG